MRQKIVGSLDEAVADIPDGARIMFGGFGGAGFPNNLIQALSRRGIKNVVAISNNCGTRDGELGIMFKNAQVRHVICSFPGPHSNHFQERFRNGEVTCELVPQGILCERMRAAAAGLEGFYTTVGVGTEVSLGKEERVLAGKRCILELPIHADFALIKAEKADELRERRSGELEGYRIEGQRRNRRSHGHCRGRAEVDRLHGTQHERRSPEDRETVHLPAHRRCVHQHHRYRPCGDGCDTGGARAARSGAGVDTR